jgi:hypothetical protein
MYGIACCPEYDLPNKEIQRNTRARDRVPKMGGSMLGRAKIVSIGQFSSQASRLWLLFPSWRLSGCRMAFLSLFGMESCGSEVESGVMVSC